MYSATPQVISGSEPDTRVTFTVDSLRLATGRILGVRPRVRGAYRSAMPHARSLARTDRARRDVRLRGLDPRMSQALAGIPTIVVDNASRDDTVAIVRSGFPAVRLIARRTTAGSPSP